MFCSRVGFFFGEGGCNGAIFDSVKLKMVAAAILDNFEWQRLTIYFYSTHRAVSASCGLLCDSTAFLLLLLLTNRLTWRLVQKLQGHVTYQKKPKKNEKRRVR